MSLHVASLSRRFAQALRFSRTGMAGVLLALLVAVHGKALAQYQPCTVTSTADSGSGTLRECAASQTGYISFNLLPLSVITLKSPVVVSLGAVAESPDGLRIAGPAGGGITISGGGTTQIFQVIDGRLAVLSISNLTFTGGYTPGSGGAIQDDSGDMKLTLTNTTFYGNYAGTSGSAVYYQSDSGAGLSITNSTFNGNSGPGNTIFANAPGGNASQTTISGNSGGLVSARSMTVSGSIIAGNGSGTQCSGCITDASDYTGANPMLGPLQLNGGLLPTMLPLPGSPVLRLGPVTRQAASAPPDERGFAGTLVAADAGAVQTHYVYVTVADSTAGGVTTSGDPNPTDTTTGSCSNQPGNPCTLRQAINLANASAGTDIVFDPALLTNATTANPATITLGATLPSIASPVDLAGPGANLLSISGANQYRVAIVPAGGYLAANGVTFRNSQANSAVVTAKHTGGAIYNRGTVSLSGSALTGNGASVNGGAIYSDSNAVLVVANSTISGNSTAGEGGGIYLLTGSLQVTDSTFNGNYAGNPGGAIYVSASVSNIAGSTISGNSSGIFGGGLFSSGATLANDIIEGNSITRSGSGNPPDVFGDYTDAGGNLINTASSTSTSTAFVDPGLAPLAYNGGPTQTMLPLPGSPALCVGTAANGAAYSTTVDQRGATHSNGYCTSAQLDAGAVQTSYSVVAFGQQPTNTKVNSTIAPPVTVSVTENGSNAANIAIPLTLTTSGAGTLAGTTTQTTTASSSAPPVATYGNLSVTAPATNNSLSAGLAITPQFSLSATSNNFAVADIPSLTQSTAVLGATNIPVGGMTIFTVTVIGASGMPLSAYTVNTTILNGPSTINSVLITNSSGVAVQQVAGNYVGTLLASATLPSLGQIGTTQTLQVTPIAPTISFNVANQTYGAAPFSVSATSNSQGAITYSVVSGPATIQGNTVTLTGAGNVQLKASQAASGNYTAGSATASFTASIASSKTSLTGAINPGTNTATLTATVAQQTTGTYPTAPSGMVTFYNGSTPIGIVTLTGSTAKLTTGAYTGSQSFTAVYNGDTNYTVSPASNAVTLTFTVNPTITFTTSASYTYGQSFQLAATSNSSGAFTYTLVSGPATVTAAGAVTVTGLGTVVVQASEAAAPGYNAGSKQASFTAFKATSSTTLTATTVKSGYGAAATLTATVAPQYSGTPSGSVTFYDGGKTLATVALSGGKASYTTAQLAGAQHTFSAAYTGDTNFNASTSPNVPLTIPVTSVSLQFVSNNLIYPLAPAFTIFVSPASGKPAPTGTVTIYDGPTAVGNYPLYVFNGGYLFGLVLPPLNVGTHTLTAVYSGDANYAPGTSAATTVTVTTLFGTL